MNRFVALDSWRGIAACMVALLHVRAFSSVEELALVRNAYLFVDFFFVLSGFVIAANYQDRLAGGFSVARFMLLRFGRVYPLHFAVLIAFWMVELPSADQWSAALSYLLLTNGLGDVGDRLWNVPSWTVSTEFFTYLAFAFLVSTLREGIERVLIAVLVISPAVIYLAKGDMSVTHALGMVRCLYGFAAGAAAWHVLRSYPQRIPAGTAAEALAALAVLFFVMVLGRTPWSIAAPIVFFAAVLVFARQQGGISRLLASRAFAFVGAVSYSIYMVHWFVGRAIAAAVAFGKTHGYPFVSYLGTERWAGDFLVLVYMAAVLGVSAATYAVIERPFRERFRRLAARPEPAKAAA